MEGKGRCGEIKNVMVWEKKRTELAILYCWVPVSVNLPTANNQMQQAPMPADTRAATTLSP